MKEKLHSFVRSREQAQGSLKDSETAADLVGAPNSVPNKVAKAVASFDRILEQGTGLPGLSGSPDRFGKKLHRPDRRYNPRDRKIELPG